MRDTTTSAKHLYSILKKAWDYNEKDIKTSSVWYKILDIDKSESHLFSKLSELISLANDVKRDIKKLDIDQTEKEDFLSAINEVEIFIIRENLASDANWQDVKNRNLLNNKTLSIINLAGRVMMLQGIEQAILSPSTIADLKNKINDLLGEISNADIDAEVKSFLLAELISIKDSLESYDNQGSSVVQNATDKALGSIFQYLYTVKINIVNRISNDTQKYLEKTLYTLLGVTFMVSAQTSVDLLPESFQEVLKALPGTTVTAEEETG